MTPELSAACLRWERAGAEIDRLQRALDAAVAELAAAHEARAAALAAIAAQADEAARVAVEHERLEAAGAVPLRARA